MDNFCTFCDIQMSIDNTSSIIELNNHLFYTCDNINCMNYLYDEITHINDNNRSE